MNSTHITTPGQEPDTQDRLARLFAAAECRTQMELAAFLGIRQSSISDAKRRGAMPAEWLITLLTKKGVSPAWILTGQEPQWLTAIGTPPPDTKPVCLKSLSTEDLLQELLRRTRE